jgi:glyceraldehyde 3-phosphate dehydrogenase
VNIAINGLGRIGRLALRASIAPSLPEAISKEATKSNNINNNDVNITHINSPSNINDLAHLIKYDSIHGTFHEECRVEGEHLIIAGHKIKVTHEKDPAKLAWQDIDIVLECSGKFAKRDLAAAHIKAGARKVIVSSPCFNADKTIVLGVNHNDLTSKDEVISIGSCTTNALAPIVKVINDNFGIESGYATTVHAYTNDQNLTDGSHKDMRRARAASMSMIPTKTGAAESLKLVIPELAGRISGSAIRVPTSNVSLIDFSFNSLGDLNELDIEAVMREAADGYLKGILGIAEAELVSVDYNHSSQSSIFDPFETRVVGKRFGRILSWYDNEWAFAQRMLDVAGIFGFLIK